MIKFLKRPATNIVFISLFTAFYTTIFFFISQNKLNYFHHIDQITNPALKKWGEFLASGNQMNIAYALIILTVLVVIIIVSRRRPYDEYHVAMLSNCLAVAIVITIIAIAVLFLLILNNPTAIVEKFILFATLHWGTVVIADLFFVILCGKK